MLLLLYLRSHGSSLLLLFDRTQSWSSTATRPSHRSRQPNHQHSIHSVDGNKQNGLSDLSGSNSGLSCDVSDVSIYIYIAMYKHKYTGRFRLAWGCSQGKSCYFTIIPRILMQLSYDIPAQALNFPKMLMPCSILQLIFGVPT